MTIRGKKMKLSWELKDSTTVWKECHRASGLVPCEKCGEPLFKHFQPLEESCPTMVEDCLGNWWKL